MVLSLATFVHGAEKVSDPGHFTSFGDRRLSEVLKVASYSNPNIPAAIEKVNQAREDVRNATAGLGPTLSVEGAARYGRERDEYNASLNLIQTVYSGGTLTANKRAAELALAATSAESAKTYQEVLNTVRLHYYDCLRAAAQILVAEEAVSLAKDHLKQAEALYRRGMAPKGDVLRVKVSVSQGEVELVGARSNLDVAWVALEHAAGSKLPRLEILASLAGDKPEVLKPPAYQAPDDVVSRALAQRMEIKAYQYYKDRAEQLAKAAAGEARPRVTLSGRGNTNMDAGSLANDEWYIQLEAKWTLYDGGALASGIRKAKAAARELLYVLESLSSQVSQEALQAAIKLRSAQERLELAKDQVATTQEDYRLALRRYNAQLGTNLDVLDARRALITGRTEYINAVYDIAAAQSDLVYAMGDDLPPEELFRGGKVSEGVLEDMKGTLVQDSGTR